MFDLKHQSVIALCVASLSAPAAAHAQEPSVDRPVEASSRRVFIVHTTDGDVIAGRRLEIGPDSVHLIVEQQPRELPLATVRRIDAEGDSLRNGTLIGSFLLGALCVMTCGQGVDSSAHFRAAVFANAGVGALLGLLIDAGVHGTTTIYRGPAAPPAASRVALSYRFRY